MSKYLFVIPTLSNGGAERVVSIVSGALFNRGQDVVVVKYHNAPNEYSISSNVKVLNLCANKEDYDKLSYVKKVKALRKIIKAEKPDFVIPFLFNVALCTFFATIGIKTTVMQSIRNNPAVSPQSKRLRAVRDFLVYISKTSFVQNNEQKQYFKKSSQHKLKVLYNPVSEEYFALEHSPSASVYTICAMGRLENQKNYPLLINSFAKAFKDTDNVRLEIYGEGSKRKVIEELINSLDMQEKIFLMGRTNDVKSVYKNANLYVLPSDFEGMPNALIEAMASGLPCVSTNCPTGPSDLIENKINGWLVGVNNEDDMVCAMKEAYSCAEKCAEFGANARETIKRNCMPDVIAKKMIDVCETVKGVKG